MSSPCPAIPTTNVLNRRGTISDLIMRKNTDDVAFSIIATCGKSAAGKAYPMAMPTTIEMAIHCVPLIRGLVMCAGEICCGAWSS